MSDQLDPIEAPSLSHMCLMLAIFGGCVGVVYLALAWAIGGLLR